MRAVAAVLGGPSETKYKRLGMVGTRDVLVVSYSTLMKRHRRLVAARAASAAAPRPSAEDVSMSHTCTVCSKPFAAARCVAAPPASR